MIGIVSTGVCLGELIQTNKDLEKTVKNYDFNKSGKSLDNWIVEHYGIEQRVKTQYLPSEIALIACKSALTKAQLRVQEIDFLVLNTTSGDYKQPTTATKVQELLGMRHDTFAIEINMPCAGNIYGLASAYSFITAGLGKKALVVGVDRMSTIVNEKDFILASMFGDAASACVVSETPKYAIKEIFLKSKADKDVLLGIKSSGSANPITEKTVKDGQHLLSMKGKETSNFIYDTVRESILHLLRESRLSVGDIDQLIIHQASKRAVLKALNSVGFSSEKANFTIDKYGNTSSASIFLTLDDYLNKESGAKNIFLIGMGSGLNWGGIHLHKTD